MAWTATKWVRLTGCQYLRKTPRAIHVIWRGESMWLPLSQLRNPSVFHDQAPRFVKGDIDISDWIADQKGIGPSADYDDDEDDGQQWMPPPPATMKSPPWWMVLGVFPTATAKEVKKRYHQLAREHHPDRGGTHEAMMKLNLAMTNIEI